MLTGLGAGSAAAATAHILIDVNDGSILSERLGDTPWRPASITKLMTAYLTFQALGSGQLKPTSAVTVSANALKEPPSKMGYQAGTVLNVDNALKMLIVKSANDIAVALAETVSGTEPKFILRMNQEAERLGMNSSHFANPNGLPDPGNYTTARDLAVLARAIWRDYPQYREVFAIPAIKAGKKILRSQNALLEHYRGTNGMKTGFVCASGFNLVASATRNGRTLIVVVLGATSAEERAELAAAVLDKGFRSINLGLRRNISSFGATHATSRPVDLTDEICKRRRKTGEEDPILARANGSALGPRFVLMPPVPVYTGRTDPAPAGTATASAAPAKAPVRSAVNVPLPRPRPSYAAGAVLR